MSIKVTLTVDELTDARVEAIKKQIQQEVGYPVAPEAIYLHALTNGMENITTDYVDAVLIAAEMIKQRRHSVSELADLGK